MSEVAERALEASFSAWAEILLAAQEPERTIDAPLVNAWKSYAGPEDSKRLASTGIMPAFVIEAIDLGFQPHDTDPQALVVIVARANEHLVVPVDRLTARSLWRATIQFANLRDCRIVADALRLEHQHGMDLGDAVFLLRRKHSYKSVAKVIAERNTVEPSTIHDILRFGFENASAAWDKFDMDQKTRRQLQQSDIGPERYRSWSKLINPRLMALLDAESLWSPSEAEEWMLALGLSYNDAVDWFGALGDIRLAQAWKGLGYSPAEVVDIKLHRIDSAEARQWSKLGVFGLERLLAHRRFWSPDALTVWSSWDPDEALDWAKVFSEPSPASTWRSVQLPLDIAERCFQLGWEPAVLKSEASDKVLEALRFADEGVSFPVAAQRSMLWDDPHQRQRWSDSIDTELIPGALEDWFASGLSRPVAVASIELGLEPAAARAFAEMGINTAEQLKRLVPLWRTPALLAEWTDANFSVADASEWAINGFSLEAARNWQGAGETLSNAQRLERHGCSPQVWAGYANLGIEPDTAIAMVQAGLEPITLVVWRTKLSGLNVLDLLAWFAVGANLEQVATWRSRGLSPAQAARIQASESGPNQAGER